MIPPESADLSFWRTRRWWLRAGQASAGIYIATVMGFASTLVAARALGPGGFGALELAVVTVAGVGTLLDFSLEEAVIHYGARALAEGDTAGLRGLIRTSLRTDLMVGAVVLVLIVALAPLATDVVSDGQLAPSLIRLAALEVFAVTVNGTVGALLIVAGQPHLRAWSAAVGNAARLAGVVVAAVLDAGALGVLAALVVGSVVGAGVQGAWAWRAGRRLWGWAPAAATPVSARRIAIFGLHSSVTTTMIALRVAAFSIVLGRTIGPAAVGVFAVAMFPVTLAEVASSPLRLLMMPEQATLAARGRPDVVWKGIVAYAKGSVLVGVPAAALGWLVLPRLLPFVYGSGFEAAVRPARILLVAALAGLVVAWSKALPAAFGRPGVRTVVSLVELALTVAALAVLADRGVTGVAVALSAVAVGSACAWWFVARRMLLPVSGSAEPA